VTEATRASAGKVALNHERCIGCGRCLSQCAYGARVGLDDFFHFRQSLRRGQAMAAVVAPSAAYVFPGLRLRFNGWLKAQGVSAIFEVGCGAGVTVKAYLDRLKSEDGGCLLTRACPAVVSFCERHCPELAKHLAPGDGPLMNMVRKIKTLPGLEKAAVAVVSPCYAKKREFEGSGLVDYNVTFKSVVGALKAEGVSLANFGETPYDPQPDEEILELNDGEVSAPGGLSAALDQLCPGLGRQARQVAGPESLYLYLRNLPGAIRAGQAPRLVEALSCAIGCNGGSGMPPAVRA
jgi:iron only hydrogenase large subunit-like protein